MAADTAAKRYSAMNFMCPFRGLNVVPAVISQGQRQAVMFMYSGILALSPDLTPVLDVLDPNTGHRGQTLSVQHVGTHFNEPNLTVHITGTGVTAGSPYGITATTFFADYSIAPAAAMTARDVTVETDHGESGIQTFTVLDVLTGGGGLFITQRRRAHRRWQP